MKKAIINVGIAPLYASPEPNQVLIDEGLYGMEAEILEERGSYHKVRMEYGYEGYVATEHLLEGEWPQSGQKLRVFAYQIDILQEPKVDSPILVSMPIGSVVQRGETKKELPYGWVCIRLADGRCGFSKVSYFEPYIPLSFEMPYFDLKWDENELRDEIVALATHYEGAAYRWGGKTMQGIDCSGLCSMAYMLAGYAIFRDASICEGYPMRSIQLSDIKKGDLLFFEGHVAMYIGGPERLYMHSTAKAGSDGVDYNALEPDSPLYREDLANGIVAVGSIFPPRGKRHA